MFTRHTTDFAQFTLATDVPATPQSTTATLALNAHTMLETPNGFVPAHSLRPGDSVASLDGGFTRIAATTTPSCAQSEMLHIPAGAIDNCTAMLIPLDALVGVAVPETCVDLEATHVALPARALIGWRGITQAGTATPELIELSFSEEEMIWAQTGCLVYAQNNSTDPFFKTMTFAQARGLLPLLDADHNPAMFSEVA